MSRKKTLAVLMAFSLVFSMSSLSYASENYADDISEDEVVYIQNQISSNEAQENQSENEKSISKSGFGAKSDICIKYNSAVSYTGKNIKASDLDVTISINGYIVDAKSIKITSGSKKNVSNENTFTIKSVDSNYKKIKTVSSDGTVGKSLYDTDGEVAAKSALKSLKKAFNTYVKKNSENSFKFSINPIYVKDSVNYKTLKSVSKNVLKEYHKEYANTAVVTLSNSGSVKKVQLLTKGAENNDGTYKVKKITLKKNKDYTVGTDGTITFDGENIAYTTAVKIV